VLLDPFQIIPEITKYVLYLHDISSQCRNGRRYYNGWVGQCQTIAQQLLSAIKGLTEADVRTIVRRKRRTLTLRRMQKGARRRVIFQQR
jgi:hypothetical protein